MTFKVVVKKGEDGYFVANCPSLKSCWSQGKSSRRENRAPLCILRAPGTPAKTGTFCQTFPSCHSARQTEPRSQRDLSGVGNLSGEISSFRAKRRNHG
jgi:hypothetical protein